MNSNAGMPGFELIYVIVNYGLGSKVLHLAKEAGVRGGTIYFGKGTTNNTILSYLSLYDQRKEVVLMGADSKVTDHALDMLNEKFKFEKPNHGILCTTELTRVIGTRHHQLDGSQEKRGEFRMMYQMIITIVSKGKAEDVIDAATKAGSKGGTIINARGSGVHETGKLFNIEIEPEKEIVMILAKVELTETVVEAIGKELEIEKPGNGIIFVQDVKRTYGIRE